MSVPAIGVANIDWRGPRPIDHGRLIGRQKSRQDLLDACKSNLVVVITAPSGVGKTSFINSAIPYLEQNDIEVMRADPWDATLTRFDELVAEGAGGVADTEMLYNVALGATTADDARKAPADILGDHATNKLVIVFDQVEELLRYRRSLGSRFLDLVSEMARASRSTHIVIARSEFRDQLRPLESDLVPWPLRLHAITDRETIAEIIAQPAADAEVELDRVAVRRIWGWWEAARQSPEHSAGDGGLLREAVFDVGLLHLQALLWSFRQWAITRDDIGPDGRELTDDDLVAFAEAALEQGKDPADPASGAQLIEGAILRYVRETIDRHTAAAVVSELEPPVRWPNGPRLMLARAAPYLSSAGYKIPQALSSLIPAALAEEFTADQLRKLRAYARRRVSRAGIAAEFPLKPAGMALEWIADHPSEARAEREWVTLEMISALEAGLRRLASPDVNILRRFAPGEADPIYDLVHDGLGSALNAWADAVLNSPLAVIGVIAARDGLAMEHSLSASLFTDADGTVAPDWGAVALRRIDDGAATDPPVVTLTGLRWVGCVVGLWNQDTELKDLVFDGCDLTGAVFLNVHLRNVTFCDCKLGGVAMLFCALDGVRFVESSRGQFDTLTIEAPRPGAVVDFDLEWTRGLFLVNLDGGTWTFAGKRLAHLVVTANENPLTLDFAVDDLEHVTVEAEHRVRIKTANVPRHVTTTPEDLFAVDGS